MKRYTPGKLDWMAAGLPVEGRNAGAPRIANHARRDVPTCRPGDRADVVRERARAAGWDVVVVVNDVLVVLGLLRTEGHAQETGTRGDRARKAAVREGGPTAADAMTPGPITVRPHVAPAEVPEAARKHDVFLVTTSDGVLMGLVRHADLEDALRATGATRAA